MDEKELAKPESVMDYMLLEANVIGVRAPFIAWLALAGAVGFIWFYNSHRKQF